jgi:two-component system sensor histidine kinase/response regulator
MYKKILVVDDTPANIQLIASLLDGEGYDIELATSGFDALLSLKEADYDLILLDVMMPEMDGFETCHKIKEIEKYKHIPVIFLTAKTEPDDITRGFKSGGVDYITKPFNAEELLSRVHTHLELKDHRESLEELVKERTEELAKVNAELEKANLELQNLDHAKNEFINIISHEIRTPLNGILGPIQLMNMDQKGEVSTRMKILNESVERLEQFSHKMVLLSELRSERYSCSLENIQLLPVLNEVLYELKNEIEEKKLDIRITEFENLKIVTDARLIQILLFNIIENAVKESKNEQLISVSNSADENDIRIFVADEAGGMSDQLLRQIFKPFITGGKFVNKNMGLGLYLSKLIVQTLSGSINVENVDNGLTVTIVLKSLN